MIVLGIETSCDETAVALVGDEPQPHICANLIHSQLLVCAGVGEYRVLGTSRDDAAGEAFDKTAKLLGLGYPGGPAIERAARGGNPARFALPRPLKGRDGCDFSFSGLKTAVRQIIANRPPRESRDIADLAAAIELAICDTLIDRAA